MKPGQTGLSPTMCLLNEIDSLVYFAILGELSSGLAGLRRPNIGVEFAWLSELNLRDIPCKGDSRKNLDRVHVKYGLFKGAFMSKTVAIFVQKLGLIWKKGGFFTSVIQDTSIVCWLKIVNH